MEKYYKAYSLKQMRKFSQWTQHENTRKEVGINRKLDDDNFLYFQENYVLVCLS